MVDILEMFSLFAARPQVVAGPPITVPRPTELIDATTAQRIPLLFVDRRTGVALFSVVLQEQITKTGLDGKSINLVDSQSGRILGSFVTSGGGLVFEAGGRKVSVAGVRSVRFVFNGDSQFGPSSTDIALTGQVCP